MGATLFEDDDSYPKRRTREVELDGRRPNDDDDALG